MRITNANVNAPQTATPTGKPETDAARSNP